MRQYFDCKTSTPNDFKWTDIKQSTVHHYSVTKCNTFQCKKRGKTALLLMHWWLETNLKLIFSTKQKPFSICYKRSTRNCIPYWQLSFFSNITQRWRSTVNCAALILFWPFSTKNHFSTRATSTISWTILITLSKNP